MNKLKEIIIVALVGVFSFPLLYAVILFANGTLRLEYGPKDKVVEDTKKIQTLKRTNKTDSIIVAQSRTFQALEQEKTELEKERARLKDQQDRMDIVAKELDEKQKNIQTERSQLESLVSKSDSLETKKYKNQAKVYASMKPLEAAQIIETLPDDVASRIFNAMNDDRQKAKIIAALSTEKASRVSVKLGDSR
jgi:flagellar motility protein MotE (MotC chaperone)